MISTSATGSAQLISKQIINTTQNLTIDPAATHVHLQGWGASGAMELDGTTDAYRFVASGAGGFAEAVLPIVAGQTVHLIIGEAPAVSSSAAGVRAGASKLQIAGSTVLIAAGGGAGFVTNGVETSFAGAGGGLTGQDGINSNSVGSDGSATGATQTSSGTNKPLGGAYLGGEGYYNGGNGAAAGGGSGYASPALSFARLMAGAGFNPANKDHPDRGNAGSGLRQNFYGAIHLVYQGFDGRWIANFYIGDPVNSGLVS